jgi:hypothetical protein
MESKKSLEFCRKIDHLHEIINKAKDHEPVKINNKSIDCGRGWFEKNQAKIEKNLGVKIALDYPSAALDRLNRCKGE